jgi:hypothetical protein
MKAVQKAAKKILIEKGCHIDAMHVAQWPGGDEHANDEVLQQQTQAEQKDADQPAAPDDLKTNTRHSIKGSQPEFLKSGDLCRSDTQNQHDPFLTCMKADDWYHHQPVDVDEAVHGCHDVTAQSEPDNSNDEGLSDEEEMIFLV